MKLTHRRRFGPLVCTSGKIADCAGGEVKHVYPYERLGLLILEFIIIQSDSSAVSKHLSDLNTFLSSR